MIEQQEEAFLNGADGIKYIKYIIKILQMLKYV